MDKLYRASNKLCKDINTKFKQRMKRPTGTHWLRWEDNIKSGF